MYIVDCFEQGKISLQQQLQWQPRVPPRHFQFVLYSAGDQKHSCSHLFFQWSSNNHCHRVYILQKKVSLYNAVLCSSSDPAITIIITITGLQPTTNSWITAVKLKQRNVCAIISAFSKIWSRCLPFASTCRSWYSKGAKGPLSSRGV